MTDATFFISTPPAESDGIVFADALEPGEVGDIVPASAEGLDFNSVVPDVSLHGSQAWGVQVMTSPATGSFYGATRGAAINLFWLAGVPLLWSAAWIAWRLRPTRRAAERRRARRRPEPESPVSVLARIPFGPLLWPWVVAAAAVGAATTAFPVPAMFASGDSPLIVGVSVAPADAIPGRVLFVHWNRHPPLGCYNPGEQREWGDTDRGLYFMIHEEVRLTRVTASANLLWLAGIPAIWSAALDRVAAPPHAAGGRGVAGRTARQAAESFETTHWFRLTPSAAASRASAACRLRGRRTRNLPLGSPSRPERRTLSASAMIRSYCGEATNHSRSARVGNALRRDSRGEHGVMHGGANPRPSRRRLPRGGAGDRPVR